MLKFLLGGAVLLIFAFLILTLSGLTVFEEKTAEDSLPEQWPAVFPPVATSSELQYQEEKEQEAEKLLSVPRKEVFLHPQIMQEPIVLPSVVRQGTSAPPLQEAISAATSSLATFPPKVLPPLDESVLLRAVVKIQCPVKDNLGKYIGAGFVVEGGIVVTAAHVVMDSVSKTCDVIFPRDRRPVHYLRGEIAEEIEQVKKRHDEEGIDVATLKLPSLDSYPEAREIFHDYPFISYPVCDSPKTLGDRLLHFGYPANYLDQNYLSRLEGEAIAYGDIQGVREQLSEDQTYVYKSPILSFTADEALFHPYMASRVASFYGDSGGLAFNATKQCILGPHRGGTMGRGEGENYSIFMVLGWEKIKNLIHN